MPSVFIRFDILVNAVKSYKVNLIASSLSLIAGSLSTLHWNNLAG